MGEAAASSPVAAIGNVPSAKPEVAVSLRKARRSTPVAEGCAAAILRISMS